MKKTIVISLLCAVSALHAQDFKVPVTNAHEQMETGAFEPTWESLMNYKTPEWFKNAKFGIWAHWGPQCVEGSGDWMARSMYEEGSPAYQHHLKHYGHPSEFGFKDVIPLWKAEKWDPERLVSFYKKIGAQYFFALANHHDNMDLWDSKYQPWNSVNMGPNRDILAEWEKAARKNHLPFGISIHADHAWMWYEVAQGADKQGEKKGVPYDGNLTKADGKGKWWEGYDPQDLYAQRHPLSKNSPQLYWGWEEGVALPSEKFVNNFYDRTLDAINRYNPDLIYFDATVLPLYPISDAGLKITAHFYNHYMRTHKGKLDGVVFGKILSEDQKKALVWDVERGAPNRIIENAWQTCSCIGNWHYNTAIYEKNEYKSAATVVKLLADIVSKNGNLLLSVPLRGDGTFDEKEEKILNEFGAWMQQNKEAIYDTRAWVKFGEGPVADSDVKLNGAGFNEGSYAKMGADEIRFTQTQKALYAIALGWPANRTIVIRSLGHKNYPKHIGKVELLGFGNIKVNQTDDALTIVLPEKVKETIAPVFKIKK